MADTNIHAELNELVNEKINNEPIKKKRREYVKSGKYAKNVNLSNFQKRLKDEVQDIIKEINKDDSGLLLLISNTQSISLVNNFDRRKFTRTLYRLAERNEQIKESLYTVIEVMGER